MQQYFSILIFTILSITFGIALLVGGRLLGNHTPNSSKNSPYECGFTEFEDARHKFHVRYYLVAIMFVLFDVEVAFLIPWALVFRQLGLMGLVTIFQFLFILVVGFVYAWRMGALEWE